MASHDIGIAAKSLSPRAFENAPRGVPLIAAVKMPGDIRSRSAFCANCGEPIVLVLPE
jgi:hypothetical protein